MVVQNHACMVFRNISFFSPENRSLIPLVGGIPLILAAMNGNVRHSEIQAHGIGALANLALNTQNKEAIVKKGGIGAIRSAKNFHKNDAEVQKCCRVALSRLGAGAMRKMS